MNYRDELKKIQDTMEESLRHLFENALEMEGSYLYEEYIAVTKAIRRIDKVQRHAKKQIGEYLSSKTIENEFI